MGFNRPSTLPPVQHPGQDNMETFRWEEDFITSGTGTTVGHKFATTADAAEWLATADNGGTNVVIDAGHGGVLRITPGTSANDFRSLQLNGEAVQIAENRLIEFGCRIRTNDADDIKFFVGLASTDVTGTTAGPILDGVNDSIGFRNILGNTATFLSVCEDDTTESTGTGGTLADDTWTKLKVVINGRDLVEFYVNGVKVYETRSNIPDANAALTVTLEVGSPTGTTATYLDVDYVYITAQR